MKGKSSVRRWLLLVLALVVAVTVSLIFSGALASSPSPKHTPDPTLPNQTTLTSSSSSTVGTTAVGAALTLSSNPYGCYSRSDYPHVSNALGYPQAVAYGWTLCSIQPPQESAQAWLYRWDCILWIFCGWTSVGYAPGYYYAYGQYRAVPAHTCSGTSNHNYLIQTYSQITDAAGNVYSAWTGNQQSANCG